MGELISLDGPEPDISLERLAAGYDALGAAFRRMVEAARPAILHFRLAAAELTGDRGRIRCTCGANPRAMDWQLHMSPSRLRRRPWRATREHQPV